jgi:hypothetical protein
MYGPFVLRAVLSNLDAGIGVLLHLSRNDVARSVAVTNLLCNAMLTSTSPTVTGDFRPLQAALSVCDTLFGGMNAVDVMMRTYCSQELLLHEDDMAEARIEAGLPVLFDRMERMISRQQHGDGMYVCLITRLLLSLAMQSRVAHAYLSARKGKWEQWLHVYKDEVKRSRSWPMTATATASSSTRGGPTQAHGTNGGSGTAESDPYKFNVMNPAAAGFGLPSSQFY